MASIQDIPFSRIPHQSELFLKYIAISPDVLRFYQHAPTMDSLQQLATGGLSGYAFPRKEIASILRRQNEQFGGDTSVLEQIDALEKPDSVAIVTGQQVGLFTGPLYTIYKALTAADIAGELRHRGINAVPVFWMETEDHDFPEATRRTVLDSETSAQIVDYGKDLFRESEIGMRSVGSLRLTESIRKVTQEYLHCLPESRWKPEIQTQLESAYAPGATFALAFARLMLQLFKRSGLIFFDPSDVEAKRLASRVFQQALGDADGFHAALMQRNRELQAAGFHAQVHVLDNSTVVFFTMDGERRVLERHPSGFRLKNSGHEFDVEELQKCAQQTPEKFSPSVLLRPLIQDHLFPTVAYVGGSSEVAYFAQIEALYSLYHRPMPVIWPRNGFTLIESEIAADMNRMGIELQDCFPGKQALAEKVLRNAGFSQATASLERLHEHLDHSLAKIRPEVRAIETRLGPMLEKAQRKILHNVHYLKSRVVRMETEQHASIGRGIDLLLNQCYPNGNLQERELTILHFLARHGVSLMDAIHSAIEIENFAHRVLQLDMP